MTRHVGAAVQYAKTAARHGHYARKALDSKDFNHAARILKSAEGFALVSIAQSLAVLVADVADQRMERGTE